MSSQEKSSPMASKDAMSFASRFSIQCWPSWLSESMSYCSKGTLSLAVVSMAWAASAWNGPWIWNQRSCECVCESKLNQNWLISLRVTAPYLSWSAFQIHWNQTALAVVAFPIHRSFSSFCLLCDFQVSKAPTVLNFHRTIKCSGRSLALVTKLFSFKFRKNIIKEANLIRIPEITSSAAGKFVQLLYTSVDGATAAWFLCQSFRLRSPALSGPVAAKTRVGPPLKDTSR